MIISIKMDDGSRYETTDTPDYDDNSFLVIEGDDKKVRLNPRHIVSITEAREED